MGLGSASDTAARRGHTPRVPGAARAAVVVVVVVEAGVVIHPVALQIHQVLPAAAASTEAAVAQVSSHR